MYRRGVAEVVEALHLDVVVVLAHHGRPGIAGVQHRHVPAILVHNTVNAVAEGLAGILQPFPRQHRAHLRYGQRVQRAGGQVGFIAVDIKGHHSVPVGIGHRSPGLDRGQAGILLIVQLGQLAVTPLVLAQIFLATHHFRLQLAGHGLQVADGLSGDQVLELDGFAVDLLIQLLEL